jgi:RNA polymerase sigma factor (sigma-70 family)
MAIDDSIYSPGGGAFPATRFSLLEAARSETAPERGRALDTLLSAYWKPVYKYIRLKFHHSPSDAQDLTQGFFAELLERNLLSSFDPRRARLRTYLRRCVDSFALNEKKAAGRQKRGGDIAHVALDFDGAEGELLPGVIDPASIPSPEFWSDFFEKEWIRSLFALAVEDLRALCISRQKESSFQIFEAYDLEGESDVSYAALATKLSLSVSDVTNRLFWARREFRRLVLTRLQSICSNDNEFRREARALLGGDLR